jgi:hypothetical protein
VVPGLAWFLPKDQRPKPEERKGFVARRSVQVQFWWAVALALASLWVFPTNQDALTSFLSFTLRALAFWVVFLYARHVVRGWENRDSFFEAARQFAEGDAESLRGAIAAGGEKLEGLRGKKPNLMERIRNRVAGFLTGYKELKQEFADVRAETEVPPPAPQAAAPTKVVTEEPVVDPRKILADFTGKQEGQQ